MSDDYDMFRVGGDAKELQRNSGGMTISTESPPQSHRNSTSNGSLFQKMRSIFENPPSGEPSPSPIRSRPVSGIFHPVRIARPADSPSRKGGFLNEHEDEADEESALLRSSAGGLEAN